ncbi:MAG: hypothetical protein H6815_09585 [Phycisphaeraceae bacterium]|nr:hypothetical protein [Phycisphaerales bacterium]MCB9860689.1 hypothetical protein [Phycisphaeraceae bacterium]
MDYDTGYDVRAAYYDVEAPAVPMVPRRTFSTVFAGPRAFELAGHAVQTYSLEVGGNTGSGAFEQVSLESLLAGPGSLAAVKADGLAALGNATNLGLFEDRASAAAFQAMIWEIVLDYDGTEESLDIEGTGSANFMASGIDAAIFEQMKQHVLAGVDTSRCFTVYKADGLENQILFDNPNPSVPLPGVSILGIAGLATVGARRRRALV